MLPNIHTKIPGPISQKRARELKRWESRNITFINDQFPVFWSRAKGANVWDVDGNRFLDFTSAFGVSTLGHSHPAIIQAIQDQSQELIHAMGDVHPSGLKPELCRMLSSITFERWAKMSGKQWTGKTILCNSGFEAVEAALKTAFLLTHKKRVLAFTGSYHGLGYGALDATGHHEFRNPFKKQIARFTDFIPFPYCYRCPFSGNHTLDITSPQSCSIAGSICQKKTAEMLKKILSRGKTGCILVEPIQGRGGEIIPPKWFLPLLRHTADQYSIPLIFDEIYTGFNRTGHLFACEDNEGELVVPDIICLGKSLTGGFPLSACVGKSRLMDQAWPESQGEALHTSTYLGHPLGAIMAITSIRLHQSRPVKKLVKNISTYLKSSLSRLSEKPCFGDIRGKGLLWGIEVIRVGGKPDPKLATKIMIDALKSGLIILNGGVNHNVISLSPSCMLTKTDIDYLIDFLDKF